jgi:hypothetical protein
MKSPWFFVHGDDVPRRPTLRGADLYIAAAGNPKWANKNREIFFKDRILQREFYLKVAKNVYYSKMLRKS